MIIDHVNLNHIRIFECVYRTQSMTAAAQELHLTQSGVSQHIKSLEDMLDIRLFDRIQQKLVPTSQARVLYENCSKSLQQIEQTLFRLKGGDTQLSGTISIGMPVEFGNNVILPLLGQFCRKHPLVKLNIKFGFASQMNEELLKGSLDFAFVDDFRMDRRILTEKVYDEVLDLCASEELIKKKGQPRQQRKYFEALEFVDYQENEPILRMWFHHHLETRHIDLNVRATVMDVQAIARLILSEAGAGVLPGHLLAKLQKEGHKIYKFKGCGKPLKNAISVAHLELRTHSPTALSALEFLKTSLTSQPRA